MEKNKDSQTQSLTELQQELKSLKALLLSRGPAISGSPTPPLPSFPPRPSIPAWQLATSPSSPSPSPAPIDTISTPSPLSTSAFHAPAVINGKGKEVEVPQD
jgi:peroxin-14